MRRGSPRHLGQGTSGNRDTKAVKLRKMNLLPLVYPIFTLLVVVFCWHPHWLEVVWNSRGSPVWQPEHSTLRVTLDVLTALMFGLVAGMGAQQKHPLLGLMWVILGGLAAFWDHALLQGGILVLLLGGVQLVLLFKHPDWQRVLFLPMLAWLGIEALQVLLTPRVHMGDVRYPASVLGIPQAGVYLFGLVLPALSSLLSLLVFLRAALLWLESWMKHRHIWLNGATVFVLLSGSIALLYVLVVGGLSALLGEVVSLVLASVLTALLVQPLQLGLQKAVNRLFYGDRDDPYRVMQALQDKLSQPREPQVLLQEALDVLRLTLKLPHASIHFLNGETLESGMPWGPQQGFSMVVQGEQVGELRVSGRGKGQLQSRDVTLLQDLSTQLARAAHALQLQKQLQQAREQRVLATEEERKRLRRDLHDGLGPALAGLGLKLEAARLQAKLRPEMLENTLSQLKTDSQELVQDVRRLVYDLRPPKLDDLGIAEALLELLERCKEAGLTTSCQLPSSFPPLSAALEVAVYRIAQEGLTNVIKHAHATKCELQVTVQAQHLHLRIMDNGKGLPEMRVAGVGSASMRERTEALSGTLLWESLSPGTLLHVVFPLDVPSVSPAIARPT